MIVFECDCCQHRCIKAYDEVIDVYELSQEVKDETLLPYEINYKDKTITLVLGFNDKRRAVLSKPQPLSNYRTLMWNGSFDDNNEPIYEIIGG